MLHAYVKIFDMTGNLEIFWELNMALVHGTTSPILPVAEPAFTQD
jgi:hypothetical protein